MDSVADYFLAAFMQYANQVSQNSARRAALVITSAIGEGLPPNRAERLYALLPANLAPSQRQFFSRLSDWRPSYSDRPIETRLLKRLSLTDQVEAETLLLAYFKAVKELLEPASRLRLAPLLPAELQKYYARA